MNTIISVNTVNTEIKINAKKNTEITGNTENAINTKNTKIQYI